jgi:hypothetical protein
MISSFINIFSNYKKVILIKKEHKEKLVKIKIKKYKSIKTENI